ncbi:MAG TPA: hypothetical protein VKR58_13315, partial [Aquella sp.]|nr:hypothetical protein [Aquella sp.]
GGYRRYYPGGAGIGTGLAVGALGGLALGGALAAPYGYGYGYGGYGYPPPVVYQQPAPPNIIVVPVSNPSQISQLAASNPNATVTYVPSVPASPSVPSVYRA